jgi:hypothetical protein
MRRACGWVVTVAVASGGGCGGGGDDPWAPDAAGPSPDAWVDHAGPLYDPARVIDVDITLAAADWDTLRAQTRAISTLFGNCLAMPFADPFTYFEGTVTVDGTTLTEVGVRKKGFLGSLSDTRPSIKLKFDEYRDNQRLLGLRTMTLNNNLQDPALIRQCLAYRTFTAAGVPAPRCNFARVRVNGTDLGIYANVESVNKDFLRRTYADPEGNLYEGTLSDFRDGWTGTFELKTNEAANDRSDLEALVDALEVPDGQLLGELEAVVDVDQFLSFWAIETLVTHYDGYSGNTNNYFVYHDPTIDRFQFMPWGADGTFSPGQSPWPGSVAAVQANAMLARRLYLLPETRDRYVDRLRALIASTFQVGDVVGEIDRMEDLLAPIANNPELAQQIAVVRTFAQNREDVIEANLVGGPPAWTAGEPTPLCFEVVGALNGTFQTTWGSNCEGCDPFLHSGTLGGMLNGAPLPVQGPIGSTAGMDGNAMPPVAAVAVVAWLADGTAELVIFQIDPAAFAPGDLPIDWATVFGVVYNYVPDPVSPRIDLVGIFQDGTLHLDMASQSPGAQITGSFSGTIIRSPF